MDFIGLFKMSFVYLLFFRFVYRCNFGKNLTMKKHIIIVILFFSIVKIIHAQSNTNFLLVSAKHKGPDGTQQWKYRYNQDNSIVQMQYYQSEKLFYTENSFTKDSENRITSFTRTFANGKTPTEQHHFEYYPDGKLWKHYFTKEKNGKTLTEGDELKWSAGSVEERHGNPITGEYSMKTIYQLDNRGNILQMQSYYLISGTDKISGAPMIYKEYDNQINPNLLRGSYINENVVSQNNPLSEYMESWSFGTAKKTYQYNANQLPVSTLTTYKTADYSIVHTDTFTYQPINKKNSMTKIFEIATSENAKGIRQMIYDGKDVYLINDTLYSIDGNVIFKNISNQKRNDEAPFNKDILKPALGKWIKDKNGNYTALK